MTSRFTSTRIATETTNVRNALLRVRDAMTNAGYDPTQYTILAQTYWSPIPHGGGIRYSEGGYTRQSTGGCGVWNRDADWANNTVVATLKATTVNAAAQSGLPNVKVIDMSSALDGRRLCENTVGLLEEKGVAAWTSAGAVDKTEWVAQIRTTSTVFGPYQIQEFPSRELLGPARDAQLPTRGLQRRHRPRRHLRALGERADEPRRAADDARALVSRVVGRRRGGWGSRTAIDDHEGCRAQRST